MSRWVFQWVKMPIKKYRTHSEEGRKPSIDDFFHLLFFWLRQIVLPDSMHDQRSRIFYNSPIRHSRVVMRLVFVSLKSHFVAGSFNLIEEILRPKKFLVSCSKVHALMIHRFKVVFIKKVFPHSIEMLLTLAPFLVFSFSRFLHVF